MVMNNDIKQIQEQAPKEIVDNYNKIMNGFQKSEIFCDDSKLGNNFKQFSIYNTLDWETSTSTTLTLKNN